ncbi:alpha/beta hydrolase [Fusibacter paucivorans]|uniref:Alpha/beta hydrolase n=1 Tax=Fusibacter paucivorans TaxID=76009 RepID=A0ABS5PMW0_9FIRM|nr:alpha/beta hydrolase [Fusibacter paucivorans]MBS7526376.1 alpha/beta hydrolase [Fusibacter paucivorans]
MISDNKNQLVDFLRKTGTGNTVDKYMLNKFSVHQTIEREVMTRSGSTHIFIHYPDHTGNTLPLFINIHGGGFVKGHREQDTVFSKNICHHANCAVLDIDYKPSPEVKYPFALNQCYDVVKWAYDNAETLGFNADKIVLCGHSAGGNLAAAITIVNQVKRDFKIAFQILDYPFLDLYTMPQLKRNAYRKPVSIPAKISHMISSAFVGGDDLPDPTITIRAAQLYVDAYVESAYTADPTVSPLLAPDEMLVGLPEALIISCGDDLLGEEAEKYAYRLIEAGTVVTAKRFLESQHGFVVRRLDQYLEAEALIFRSLQHIFS